MIILCGKYKINILITFKDCRVPPWKAVGDSKVGGTPAKGPLGLTKDLQLSRKLNSAWASAPRTATRDSAALSTVLSAVWASRTYNSFNTTKCLTIISWANDHLKCGRECNIYTKKFNLIVLYTKNTYRIWVRFFRILMWHWKTVVYLRIGGINYFLKSKDKLPAHYVSY